MGCKWTPIQAYDDVLIAEKGWKEYCEREKIQVDTCPKQGMLSYPKRYETYVCTNWPRSKFWGTHLHFLDTKAFRHGMDGEHQFERYRENCERSGDFLRSGFRLDVVAKNNLTFFKAWRDVYQAHNAVFMVELLHE